MHMGIAGLLVFTTFYFVCMAIDVVLFFLVIRVLVSRWRIWWLAGFDAAGQKLIDQILLRIRGLWYRAFHTHLSDRGQLITTIVTFYVAWLAVHVSGWIVW
jgi:hypothetical protein